MLLDFLLTLNNQVNIKAHPNAFLLNSRQRFILTNHIPFNIQEVCWHIIGVNRVENVHLLYIHVAISS